MIDEQAYDGAENMAAKTNGAAVLVKTNNPKCIVNNHLLNVCIANGCKVTELCVFHLLHHWRTSLFSPLSSKSHLVDGLAMQVAMRSHRYEALEVFAQLDHGGVKALHTTEFKL